MPLAQVFIKPHVNVMSLIPMLSWLKMAFTSLQKKSLFKKSFRNDFRLIFMGKKSLYIQ